MIVWPYGEKGGRMFGEKENWGQLIEQSREYCIGLGMWREGKNAVW